MLIQNQANKYTLTTAGTTTLEIQDLDNSDTGYYTCRADNSEASAAASGKITVRVAGELALYVYRKIKLIVILSTYSFLVPGIDFSISCTAEGDSSPQIEWRFTRSGQTITLSNSTEHLIIDSTDQTIQSRMLTLSFISAKDNRDYQCFGENFKAIVEYMATIVLIPSTSDPVIDSIFLFTTVEIFEGEIYFQDCVAYPSAYAEPPPTVRWSSSGFEPITSNTTDYVIYPNNTLVVTGNRQLSGSMYTCIATSGGKTESRSFTLLVHSCAVVEVTPTGPLNSVEHVNATLTCSVNGLPPST